jgi:hypothetical protein
MKITRRKFIPSMVAWCAAGWAIVTGFLAACTASVADDLTLIIGAAEGVADIALPLIPAGSALIPFFNTGLNALSQVVTEWGSTDPTATKWEKMLKILLTIPGEILALSPADQAIVAGFGAAVQLIINTIVTLQSGPPAVAGVAARAVKLVAGAPNPHGISGLLKAIEATQAKLAKL